MSNKIDAITKRLLEEKKMKEKEKLEKVNESVEEEVKEEESKEDVVEEEKVEEEKVEEDVEGDVEEDVHIHVNAATEEVDVIHDDPDPIEDVEDEYYVDDMEMEEEPFYPEEEEEYYENVVLEKKGDKKEEKEEDEEEDEEEEDKDKKDKKDKKENRQFDEKALEGLFNSYVDKVYSELSESFNTPQKVIVEDAVLNKAEKSLDLHLNVVYEDKEIKSVLKLDKFNPAFKDGEFITTVTETKGSLLGQKDKVLLTYAVEEGSVYPKHLDYDVTIMAESEEIKKEGKLAVRKK